jgi:hypothetical protein
MAPPVKKVQYRNQEPRGRLMDNKELNTIIKMTMVPVLGINP